MGSLASRPKVPAVQTVYMPVYSPSPSVPGPAMPVTPPPVSAPAEGTDVPQPSDGHAAQRSASLLERRRGVLSTVLTGFRGILNQTVTPLRKSLLGE